MLKLLLLTLSTAVLAQEPITAYYKPEPLIPGNRRIDEVKEWSKLHPGIAPPPTEQEKEYFRKQGLPIPGEGVKIESLDLKTLPKEFVEAWKKKSLIELKYGYNKKFSFEAKHLLEMPEDAKQDFEETKTIFIKPGSTHLRKHADEIPMNYVYKAIPPGLVNTAIAFSPANSFVNGGWNGIVEFFISPGIDGVCKYEEINVPLTGTAALIPPEIVTYLINNKVTTISVEGNEESGIIYRIEWDDNEYRHSLHCAMQEFSEENKQKIIALAQKIDNK